MKEQFERTAMIIGESSVDILAGKKVAVFGVGGVGGFCVEALARTGIGSFILIDNDTVSPSNINRQIIALHSTIGRKKTDVIKERINDINPDALVQTRCEFYLPGMPLDYLLDCDYVVDAIDTTSAKLAIAEFCDKNGIPLISAMGAGNKTDPTAFTVTDIYKTQTCPLCRVMRKELRARGISRLKVVYSPEQPVKPTSSPDGGRPVPGSLAFVPSCAGLIIAKTVVFDIIKQ